MVQERREEYNASTMVFYHGSKTHTQYTREPCSRIVLFHLSQARCQLQPQPSLSSLTGGSSSRRLAGGEARQRPEPMRNHHDMTLLLSSYIHTRAVISSVEHGRSEEQRLGGAGN
jgi:hypothetical protein